MRDAFGEMNGLPGEKATWEWIIKTKQGLLAVYDYKWWWSIGYRGSGLALKENLREDAEILRDAIKDNVARIQISPKQIKKEKIGGIILNPYSLFNGTASSLLEEAETLMEQIDSYPKGLPEGIKAINRMANVRAMLYGAFLTNYLAVEGFVNIVYQLFSKKRYKNYLFVRKLQNESIPIKLLEMDKYCHDFKKTIISIEDELFKAFQYLTNIRNDFLHANIVKGMETHIIQQQDDYLLRIKEESQAKYGISANPSKITNYDVIRAQRLVRKIIAKIIQGLSVRMQYVFAMVHGYRYLPYYYDSDGRVNFPIGPDDYVPDEVIENEVLSESDHLDDEYYQIEETEYPVRM
jgi:hypothetical protein